MPDTLRPRPATRQQRNFIATLLLSEGVPLLLGGDEFGRSQGGNNNAYCQDNELTWLDWSAAAQHTDLVDFTARLCRLSEAHPVFRRRQFFTGTLMVEINRWNNNNQNDKPGRARTRLARGTSGFDGIESRLFPGPSG